MENADPLIPDMATTGAGTSTNNPYPRDVPEIFTSAALTLNETVPADPVDPEIVTNGAIGENIGPCGNPEMATVGVPAENCGPWGNPETTTSGDCAEIIIPSAIALTL